MATKTPNYKLNKPAQTDFYDVDVQNENMDIIDAALEKKVETEDFEEYKDSSIVGEDGVHGIRYYDGQLQVDDGSGNWNTASSGVGIEVDITVPTGSAVTATDGTTTLTGTAEANSLKMMLPNYGTWNFSATLNGQTSNTVTLTCDASKVYAVTLTYFSATIKVTAKSGSVVTIKKGSTTQTATSNGTATFTVKEAGTYSVYATYNDIQSNSTSVTATTSGSTYTASVSFITLTVVVDSGSTIVVSKGSYNYTKVGTGSDVFYLPETGTWAITATKNGDSVSDTISISSYSAYSKTLAYYKVYGVTINLSNSNSANAVTYTDDAVGMTGGSSTWDSLPIFKDIKPCVMVNGVVQYYLNPNDFTKKADGNTADITTVGNDVMIEIPKVGFKISTSGSTLTIKVTDNPNAGSDGFKYYAHTRTTEGDCNKLYIGAYAGYVSSSKLYSSSGKTPTVSQTIGTFRTQAQARGSGYDLISFYPLTLLQCLFIIRYKSIDSQTALGKGYVDASAKTSTGATNTNGMYYGTTSGTVHVKFAGIEDFWGNVYYWIDGLYSDSNRNILTAFKDFNDTGSGYTSRGQGASSNLSGYMSKPQGTTESGFVAKETNGSTTTYFADGAHLYASSLPAFGGAWNSGDIAGAFRLYVNYSASTSSSFLGGRLMYLKAS